MNHRRKHLSTYLLGIAALLGGASSAWAQTAPGLGAASSFAALGGAGVTCTSPFPPLPALTVTGNVGSPGTAPSLVTGFPGFTPGALPCSLSGTVQLGAAAAYADFITAYNKLASNLPADGYVCPSADATHNLVGDLRDTATRPSLSPGVYCITGVGTLTGQLTLAGPANGVWIFKGTSSITPNGGATPALRSRVVMANGGRACNVFWQLTSQATFSNTDFVGNVLAGSNITFTGSSLAGRALANTESVTMTGSSITACDGGATQPPSPPSCDKDHKHHRYHKHDKHHKHHKDDVDQCDCDDDGHGNGHDGHDDDNGHGSDHGNPFGSNDEHGRKGGDR